MTRPTTRRRTTTGQASMSTTIDATVPVQGRGRAQAARTSARVGSTPPAGAPTGGVLRERAVDIALILIMSILGLIGFRTIFGGTGYLWLGVAGIGLGTLIAVVAVRAPVLVAVAAAVVVYAWAGALIVDHPSAIGGFVPGAAGLRSAAVAAVHGWRDLLTTAPPVVGASLLAIPYLCGLFATVVGLQLALRTRTVMAPLAGPAGVLAAGIALGTARPAALLLQGGAFAILALAFATLRHRRNLPVGASGRRTTAGRSSAAGVLGLTAVVVAGLALLPGDGSRYVVRDHVQPPFDVSAYPSPLSGYRRFEVTDKAVPMFTLSHLPAGARIRLAVMDNYDGVVWGVAGGRGATTSSGTFERVGDPIANTATGSHATVTVTLGQLGGVWLPTVGSLSSIHFTGPRAASLVDAFRYNTETGVAVDPATLAAGDQYTMSVVVPAVPAIDTLAGSAAATAIQPDLTNVPDAVAGKGQDWTQGSAGPIAALQAILAKLHAGAFSDGTVESDVVSPPGAGQRRIQTFLTAPQLVGDAEQYSAALALVARSLDIPARIVLGVVPPADFDGHVTGKMVSAWVEVDISGAGWVPLDPTPPVTNQPVPQQLPQDTNILTKIVTPPLSAAQAAADQPGDPSGLHPPLTSHPGRDWTNLIRAAYAVLALLLIAAALAAIVRAKQVRRRRRRTRGGPMRQITASWQELIDRLADCGLVVPATGTRRQRADAVGYPQIAAFAHRVDEAVFAPGDPDAGAAAALWDDMDAFLAKLRGTRSRTQRFAGMVNPATLLPRWRRSAAATLLHRARSLPAQLEAQAARVARIRPSFGVRP